MKKDSIQLIEKEFQDVIKRVRDTDISGRESSLLAIRRTFVFIDNSKLYITQRVNHNNEIEAAWYDLYDSDNNEIIKFHKHHHDNKKYTTKTCPFHIQYPSKHFSEVKRLPNFNFRDLFSIMEFIRMMIIYTS